MRTRFIVAGTVLLLSLGCSDDPESPTEPAAAPGLSQRAQGTLDGRIHVQWGDPQFGRGPGRLQYKLVDDRGQATELLVDSVLARRFGGPVGLDRKRGRIRGEAAGARKVRVR